MKKNSNRTNRNKINEQDSVRQRMHINELSVQTWDNIIAALGDSFSKKELDSIKAHRDWTAKQQKSDKTPGRFVYKGAVPLFISKATRSSKSIDVEYPFMVYQHFPSTHHILVVKSPKATGNLCAAVVLGKDGQIYELSDTKIKKELLKEIECVNFYTGDNFKWMIDIIQPYTRDAENNPMPADKKRAKELAVGLEKLTATYQRQVDKEEPVMVKDGIKFDYKIFMRTRSLIKKRESRVEDYVYIGGFNITNDLKVRISRYIGQDQNHTRIYHTYIKYFDYAFMIRIYWQMQLLHVEGGLASGTVCEMLKKKGYLNEDDPGVAPLGVTSNMYNIYPFMKELQKMEYVIDGEDINVCDYILNKIFEIVDKKEYVTTRDPAGTLVLDRFIGDYNKQKDKFEELKKKNSNVSISDVSDLDDEGEGNSGEQYSDDDMGM